MLCLDELIHGGLLQVLLFFLIESTSNVQKFFRILGKRSQHREFLENADPAFANSRYAFVGDTRLQIQLLLEIEVFYIVIGF